MSLMGHWLEVTRKKHHRGWAGLFFVLLAALVGLNFFIHPHHAEYIYDKYPGFWAVFGLAVAVLIVLVMKKIIQPLIVSDREYYDGE